MMVTAVAALALAAAGASAVQVQGPSTCPTAAEVMAVLPEMLPAAESSYPDVAWIEAAGLALQIELRTPGGEPLFSRRLTSSGSCAELATIAAVVIAAWTAERNPGLSLLQPGVPAPPRPLAPPPAPPSRLPAPSPPVAQTLDTNPAVKPPRAARELDLSAGLGGTVNSAGLVAAARLEMGIRGRRWGLRGGFAAETARSTDIEKGTVSWRRYGLSLGPTFTAVKQPVMLAARADVFAGLTTVAGDGFDFNHRSSALSGGLALSLRLGAASGWIRPWIEIGGQYWLADQRIAIARELRPNSNVPLPSVEGRLLAGISILLAR